MIEQADIDRALGRKRTYLRSSANQYDIWHIAAWLGNGEGISFCNARFIVGDDKTDSPDRVCQTCTHLAAIHDKLVTDGATPLPATVIQSPPGEGPGKSVDVVNHPPHYTTHPSGVECIQIAEHYGFCLGNTIKYIWRAGLKGDDTKALEDLKKAAWYLAREIERREK